MNHNLKKWRSGSCGGVSRIRTKHNKQSLLGSDAFWSCLTQCNKDLFCICGTSSSRTRSTTVLYEKVSLRWCFNGFGKHDFFGFGPSFRGFFLQLSHSFGKTFSQSYNLPKLGKLESSSKCPKQKARLSICYKVYYIYWNRLFGALFGRQLTILGNEPFLQRGRRPSAVK